MSGWRPIPENESDSEDEETSFDVGGREAIIFVLDAFLYKNLDHFQNATKLIRDALLSGLMVNDKDLIGIVFANTKESPAPKDSEALRNIIVPANCTLFLPLRQLNKDILEYYFNFTEENYFDFENTYGVCLGKFYKISNMIRLCGNMFQQSGMKLANQTIVYFTDRALPHKVGSQEFQKAIQKANDLEGQNIDFCLIPMVDDFDFEPFYKEFLSLAKDIDMDSFIPTDPKLAREMIADRKLKLDINKRCLGHVNWNLCSNLELSVKFYNYYQKYVYPQKVTIQREDNSLVTVKLVNYIIEKDPITGEVINKRELRTDDEVYELACGNESVQLPENEMLKLMYPYQPILQLLGFRDLTAVRKQHYIRSCSFIFPDDNSIAGSTKLFTALWQKCREKEKIAVCIFIPRKKSKPSYVALVPVSANDEDESNIFMNSDGFKVVYLPLSENLKHYDLTEWNVSVSPLNDGENLFKKIIKKLKVKYVPNKIKNPGLEDLQSRLLALAFNITTEGVDDIQMPSGEKQDERIEQHLKQFESIFGAEVAAGKRRAAAGHSKENPPKVMKEDFSVATIDNLIATGNVGNLNKHQIISFLKLNDVKVSASLPKGELVKKLLELRNPTEPT